MAEDEWDKVGKEAQEQAGDGNFVKLEDGEAVELAFLGTPKNYQSKPFKDGDKPGVKVLANVFVIAERRTKVLDMAVATFKSLLKTRERFPLRSWTIDLSRQGKGTRTRYTILPCNEIKPDQRAYLDGLELEDLGELAERIGVGGGEAEPAPAPAPAAPPAAAPPPAPAPAPAPAPPPETPAKAPASPAAAPARAKGAKAPK